MKNILTLIFCFFTVLAISQTEKTFRYSQDKFQSTITLPELADSVAFAVSIPAVTTATNQIAYGSGAPNLTGSNAFMFNGSRLILNRSASFADNATFSISKAAADEFIQYWRSSTGVSAAVDSSGWYNIRTGSNKIAIGGVSSLGAVRNGSAAASLAILMPGGALGGGSEFWFQLNSSSTLTSGTAYGFRIERTFAPTSGTAAFGGVTQRDVINQTGGASGITWGFWASPTLTSAADYRAYRYDLNTGTGLYFAGTAPNYLGGTLGVGGVTRGASENWFSATDTYITPSDSLKLSGTTIDIAGAVKITGATTATGDITVPAEAYSSSWNGSNEVPTKNDIYDAIQSSDWTNTVTQSGSDTLLNSAAGYGHFQRIGNIVSFTLRVEIALTSAGDANTVYIDPPIASNFTTAASDVIGTATMDPQSLSGANTQRQRCVVFASDSDDKIGVSFDPVASLSYPENRMYISVSGSYVIQ